MDRISVFARRQRIKNLEQWTMYAILAEAFFLALSPTIAAAAVVFGVITWFLRGRIDTRNKMRTLPFDRSASRTKSHVRSMRRRTTSGENPDERE